MKLSAYGHTVFFAWLSQALRDLRANWSLEYSRYRTPSMVIVWNFRRQISGLDLMAVAIARSEMAAVHALHLYPHVYRCLLSTLIVVNIRSPVT